MARRRWGFMLRRGSVLWLEFSVGTYNLFVGGKLLFARLSGLDPMTLDSYGAFSGPAWLWGLLQVAAALAVWHAALTSRREWRAAALALACVISWTRSWLFFQSTPASTGVEATFVMGMLSAVGAALHVWRLYDEEGHLR